MAEEAGTAQPGTGDPSKASGGQAPPNPPANGNGNLPKTYSQDEVNGMMAKLEDRLAKKFTGHVDELSGKLGETSKSLTQLLEENKSLKADLAKLAPQEEEEEDEIVDRLDDFFKPPPDIKTPDAIRAWRHARRVELKAAEDREQSAKTAGELRAALDEQNKLLEVLKKDREDAMAKALRQEHVAVVNEFLTAFPFASPRAARPFVESHLRRDEKTGKYSYVKDDGEEIPIIARVDILKDIPEELLKSATPAGGSGAPPSPQPQAPSHDELASLQKAYSDAMAKAEQEPTDQNIAAVQVAQARLWRAKQKAQAAKAA